MVVTPPKKSTTSFTQAVPALPLHFPNNSTTKESSNFNYPMCLTRLEDIIKSLQENFNKWQLAQKRGLSLCNSIEAIKTRCLEASSKTSSSKDLSLYSVDLKAYCDKLAIITSIFFDIAENARESLKQLRALNEFSCNNNTIFYRSWKLSQHIEFAENLVVCYEQETKVKQRVLKEIAHSANRAALICITSAWEYPQHVDEWISMAFTFLRAEIHTRKN